MNYKSTQLTAEQYQQYQNEWVLWTQGQLTEEHSDESTHQTTT